MLVFSGGVLPTMGSALRPGKTKLEQAGRFSGSWNLLFFFLLIFHLKPVFLTTLCRGCGESVVEWQDGTAHDSPSTTFYFWAGGVEKEGIPSSETFAVTGEMASLCQAPSTQPISDIPWSHLGLFSGMAHRSERDCRRSDCVSFESRLDPLRKGI